ncbi:MAG: hypothetical protein AAGI03_01890 [Pseudomonadota bacterium]
MNTDNDSDVVAGMDDFSKALSDLIDEKVPDDFEDGEGDGEGLDRALPEEQEADKIVTEAKGRRSMEDAEDEVLKDRQAADKAKKAKDDDSGGEGDGEKAKAKPADDADKDGAKAADDADDDAAKGDDKDGKTPPALSDLDTDALLEGVDADKAAEINRRIAKTDGVMRLFDGHKEDLAKHGETAEDQVRRMIEINDYAHKHPSDYLQWVADKVAGDKALDVFTEAAAKMGYELTPKTPEDPLTAQLAKIPDADLEDDEFDDATTKALKATARAAKAQAANPPKPETTKPAGPDTPENAQRRQFDNWRHETGEDGKPKRPLLDDPRVADLMAGAAQRKMAELQRALSLDELDVIYADAAAVVSPPSLTAQATDDDAKDEGKENAAQADRHIRASKSVDGSGQRAPRRPAVTTARTEEDFAKASRDLVNEYFPD